MIKNLVFSGAGTKIYSFIGSLKLLEEKKLLDNFENIIGTSSGSIISIFLCLGFKVDEIEKIILNINTQSFKELDTNNIFNFFNDYGIDDAKNIKKIIKIILKAKIKKETITFKELYEITNKNLIICSTCLNKNESEYFNHINSPDLLVNDAIIMSISIPILFKPVVYNNNYYVDGGLTNHYPINYFEDMKNTLGILISSDLSNYKINNIEDYICNVLLCSMNKLTKDNHDLYKDNTIYLEINRSFIDFDLTLDKKKEYIKIGYDSAKEFISKNIDRFQDNTNNENIDDTKENTDNTKENIENSNSTNENIENSNSTNENIENSNSTNEKI